MQVRYRAALRPEQIGGANVRLNQENMKTLSLYCLTVVSATGFFFFLNSPSKVFFIVCSAFFFVLSTLPVFVESLLPNILFLISSFTSFTTWFFTALTESFTFCFSTSTFSLAKSTACCLRSATASPATSFRSVLTEGLVRLPPIFTLRLTVSPNVTGMPLLLACVARLLTRLFPCVPRYFLGTFIATT